MTVATFDTHRIVKRLKEAGASDALAETVTDVVRESREVDFAQLATKQDLDALRHATRQDLDTLRQETKQEFALLRQEIGTFRGDLRKDLEILQYRVITRLGGLIVLGVGALAVLDKVL